MFEKEIWKVVYEKEQVLKEMASKTKIIVAKWQKRRATRNLLP